MLALSWAALTLSSELWLGAAPGEPSKRDAGHKVLFNMWLCLNPFLCQQTLQINGSGPSGTMFPFQQAGFLHATLKPVPQEEHTFKLRHVLSM